MALLAATALALLARTSSAQTEHVWSSVAWILHGERTPIWGSLPQLTLTPLGAQQMFAQGSLLRARYLSRDPNEKNTEYTPIVGIEANAIDNSQLTILAPTDPYMVTSAQAFTQGLYPPILQAFSNNSGGMEAALNPNGSIVNYPLGGYQYPNIKTVSGLDYESVWVGGHVGCAAYTESLLNFRNDDIVATVYNNTLNFYQNLWRQVLHEVFPFTMANFANAYFLYDYAAFRYNHNNATRKNLTEDELLMMRRFASVEQRNKNANLSVSGQNRGDMIRAVAGRTMAAKTVDLLRDNMRQGGYINKLNLAFTPHETFVAFFALSGLIIGDHTTEFAPLPEPGAMMLFELFSIGGNASSYPNHDELYVRFLYRNGTDAEDQLTPFALFNGTALALPLTTFMANIQPFGVSTQSEWCRLCNSFSLFCRDLRGGSSGGFRSSNGGGDAITPPLAGVIGAAVTLIVAGILFLLAVAFGSIRFHGKGSKARKVSLGGFKGSEKMASDTDLTYANGGTRHERTGSWELRGGGKAKYESEDTASAGVFVQPRDLMHPNKNADDDDAVSEYGQTPVKPREF